MSLVKPLEIRLFGPPAVQWNGEAFSLSRRQARALLYYLAVAGRPVTRDQLSFLFWPDEPENKARRNLSRLLSYLRTTLPGDGVLDNRRDSVSLGPKMLWCDALRFEGLISSGEAAALEEAIELYTGPFLAGFSLEDSPEYDLWLSQSQGHYERLYLQGLERIVEVKRDTGDFDEAVNYARRYLAEDELAEEMHRQLIGLYGATGNRAAVRRQYEVCLTILERELGVSPLPETRRAYEMALESDCDGASVDQAPAVEVTWTTLPSLDLPLLGRKEAWQQLKEKYARLGSGGVLFIGGEPGVGKSRLLQEFATNQGDRLVLTGNNHAGTQELAYQPLLQALRQALSQSALWSGIRPIWLAEATAVLPELADTFPDLPEAVKVEPNQAQARMFEALSQIFLGLANQKPMLLCLDDLHWADETTLSWLNYLAGRLANSKLLLLSTYRSQEAQSLVELLAALRRAGCQAHIHLEGLSVVAIKAILEQLPTPAHPTLALKIHQATAGNAFFVLEMIRALLESDQLSEPPERLPLPRTVQEVIRGRLERLEPLDRQVLEAAAVLSPDLDFSILRPTTGRAEGEVIEALDNLTRRQLLVEEGQELRFQHDLTREVVYEDLSRWRQQALHRRAAEALLEVHQRDPGRVAAQTAQHFDEAGDASAAFEQYLVAAKVTQDQYAYRETIDLLERALMLMPDPPPDPIQAAQVHEDLGDSLIVAGQYGHAEQAYLKALDYLPLEESLRRVELYQKMAATLPAQGRMLEADDLFQKALTTLGQEPGQYPAEQWWQAWLSIKLRFFEALYFQARLDDMEKLTAEIEPMLQQYGTPRHQLDYHSGLTMLLYHRRRFRLQLEDLKQYQQRAEIAAMLGDKIKIAFYEFGLGFSSLNAGQYDQAGEYLRQALIKAEALGYLPVQNQCLVYLAIVARLQGDVERARSYQVQSYEIANLVKAPFYTGAAEAHQAWLHYRDGQWDLAEAGARSALEEWNTSFYPFHWLAHWPLLAMALSQDDLVTAVDSAADMLDPVQQWQSDDIMSRLEQVVDHYQVGQETAARQALEDALALAISANYL